MIVMIEIIIKIENINFYYSSINDFIIIKSNLCIFDFIILLNCLACFKVIKSFIL